MIARPVRLLTRLASSIWLRITDALVAALDAIADRAVRDTRDDDDER